LRWQSQIEIVRVLRLMQQLLAGIAIPAAAFLEGFDGNENRSD